jgi:uncharacterized protein YjbI with pentapeptide repeats
MVGAMQIRAVRDTKVTLPGDEPDDLEPLDRLPHEGESISERVISGDAWTRGTLTGLTLRRSWLTDADLSTATFTNATLDRCVLTACSLVGATFDTVTAKDVIFDNCRLDYATFERFKSAGPIAFVGCSLTETTFNACVLTAAVFDNCKLAGVSFDNCDLRGADLRGNDIAGLTAASGLRGVVLAESQLPALTELLVSELSIRVSGDPH